MEDYIKALNEILSEEDKHIEALDKEFLRPYFTIVKSLDFQEIITNNDKFGNLIKAFEEEYCFNKYMVNSDESQKHILRKLIYTIKVELEEGTENLVLLMPLIIYLDYKKILCNEIFLENRISKDIKEFCFKILRNFHINISTSKTLPVYDCEAKLIEKYKSNFNSLDFTKIYDFLDSVERGGRNLYNPFLEICSLIIISNDFEEYISILDAKKEAFEIKLLIKKLSDIEKTKVGVETKNPLVKFEVIRELLYFNKKEISNELLLEISNIIIDFTYDSKLWREFIKYYLAFPSRSPKFFTSLGFALPKIRKEAIEIILQEIKIDKYSNIESRTAINNCFSSNNLKNIINDYTKIIYERWVQYIENYKDNITELVLTDAIDMAIFYIVNIMEEVEFKTKCKSCSLAIKEINNIWFNSKTDQRTFYNKKLSLLFALGFRLDTKSKSKLLESLKTSTIIEEETLGLIEYNWHRVENKDG